MSLGRAALKEPRDCPGFSLELRFELAIVGEVQVKKHGSVSVPEKYAQGPGRYRRACEVLEGAGARHEPENSRGDKDVLGFPGEDCISEPLQV